MWCGIGRVLTVRFCQPSIYPVQNPAGAGADHAEVHELVIEAADLAARYLHQVQEDLFHHC